MGNALRFLVPALSAVFAAVLATCDSPDNPYWDPANVTLSSSTLVPQDSVARAGDTVRIALAVHLPYLVSSLTVAMGDSAVYAVTLPTSSSVVDFADTVEHVFASPDTYDIVVTAVRDDGGSLTQALRVTIGRRLPGGPCAPLAPGVSLNQAIRDASPAVLRPRILCPEPGLYEQGTLRVFGVVKVAVE